MLFEIIAHNKSLDNFLLYFMGFYIFNLYIYIVDVKNTSNSYITKIIIKNANFENLSY